MELLWRLIVAGVAIVGPTVLFLGMWHGLMRLRDDELVRRVCARMDETPSGVGIEPPAFVEEATTRALEQQASSLDAPVERTVRCVRCGQENEAGHDFCRLCQAALEDG